MTTSEYSFFVGLVFICFFKAYGASWPWRLVIITGEDDEENGSKEKNEDEPLDGDIAAAGKDK